MLYAYYIISGAIIILLAYFIAKINNSNKMISSASNEEYKKLVVILDNSTNICNKLSSYQLNKIKSKLLIDYYINTLSVLESLLKSIHGLSPKVSSANSINTANLLASDCYKRCQRVELAFKQCTKKGRFSIRDLLSRSGPGYLDQVGCYFCSRPYLAKFFEKVSAVVSGKKKSVFSCRVCATELKEKNTATILSFMKGNVPIHWSKFPGYKSDRRYWNINNKKLDYKGRPKIFEAERKKPNLRLIDPTE